MSAANTPEKKLQTVSFIMPVLNEEKYLESAVKSIFEQKNLKTSDIQVILALGPSTDITNTIAESLKSQFPVKTVLNPTGKTPAGLNLAIGQADHEVIVRVDAHSVLSPDYASLAMDILNETGAANVGGLMKAEGTSPFQKAVAWAYKSRVGLGGGSYHVGGQAGPSDSVYLGVFRADSLKKLGGFNEQMLRGQDWELNLRIRQSGQVVWFDPRLEVTYYPRSRLSNLGKQFFDTGAWRAQLTVNHLKSANLRYFAPPLLVLAIGLGIIASFLGLGCIGLIPAFIYSALVFLSSLTAKGLGLLSRLALLIVLPTMHLSWGSGFLSGLTIKR
ncbi:MAG: glycosyltransferase family 2 protein [Rhodoluna sp.]